MAIDDPDMMWLAGGEQVGQDREGGDSMAPDVHTEG